MPRRPSINAITPHTSTNAVNEALGALSRKLTSNHIESATVTSPTAVRRASIKMESILHAAKKDKKRSDSAERGSREKKRSPLTIRSSMKSKERASSRSSALGSPGLKPPPAGKFEMIMESPPVILHGSSTYSNGALLSGRLKFNVVDPSGEVTLKNFNMRLQITTTSRKPVSKECTDCAVKHDTINEWSFLSEPKKFLSELDNEFPWSYLLDGKYPATTQAQLGGVTYAFVVDATTTHGENITFLHPMHVARAIPPGPDKASIRIFPPTNLTGRVSMSQVIHPIGRFPVTMSLSGVVEKKQESQTRWRLKKMMWRIEEHCKIKSTPCEKHKTKVSEGKAVQHTETRTLGSDEMKNGWKTDFDTLGGEITLEFEASVATKPAHKPACDVDSQSGLEVKHNLVIELIVAEEFVPNKNTNLITPTGAARVLRMQFALVVTERAGMGISWEDEMPPMYEQVPPSPPGYGTADNDDGAFGGAIIEDYSGPAFDYVDLERVPTTNPSDPPTYRERDPATLNFGLPMRDRRGSNDSVGPSRPRQPFGNFRLDELEAEPQFAPRRRGSAETDGEPEVDYGQGSAGEAAR